VLIGVDVTCFGGLDAGVSRYLREMLSGMMAAGDDEYVFYSPMPVAIPLPPGRWRAHFRTGQLPLLPGRWARSEYPRLIAADRLDVFWGQNALLPLGHARSSLVTRPSSLNICSRVLTVHDLASLVYPRTLYLRNRFSWKRNIRASLRVADAVVAVSSATARLLRELLGVPAGRITVIPEGCSNRLRPVDRARARTHVKQEFGLPDKFILTVGTLEPRKDHATLLAALRLRPELPMLAVVGAVGWKSRGILRAVRQAEARGQVRFLGRVNDDQLARLYGAAALTVYPSLYEGFGLPVVEAMACGCPVLCSWSSSLPEVGGTAARYFERKNPHHLAQQLARLLGDEAELDSMRTTGLTRAATFSFARAAQQMLDLMRTVVARGGRRTTASREPC